MPRRLSARAVAACSGPWISSRRLQREPGLGDRLGRALQVAQDLRAQVVQLQPLLGVQVAGAGADRLDEGEAAEGGPEALGLPGRAEQVAGARPPVGDAGGELGGEGLGLPRADPDAQLAQEELARLIVLQEAREVEAEQGHPPGVDGDGAVEELQQLAGQPRALDAQRLQEGMAEERAEEGVGQQPGERGVAVLVVDEEPELLVLHQLLVDQVEELLPLLRLQLQVMEEHLGGARSRRRGPRGRGSAAGGPPSPARGRRRARGAGRGEAPAGKGRRSSRRLLARGVTRSSGSAGEQEMARTRPGIVLGLVEQPAAQGIGELGAVDDVDDQVAVPGQAVRAGCESSGRASGSFLGSAASRPAADRPAAGAGRRGPRR